MKTSKKGMAFCDVLGIVFIILKLCHVIKWAWIWVLSPIWISTLIEIIVLSYITIKIGKNKRC